MTKNDLVGTVTMSMVRFMKQPFVAYTEKVPIYYPGATRTTMKVCRYHAYNINKQLNIIY